MKDEKNPLITLEDPQLPAQLAHARRNHGGMTVPDDFFAQFERKMNAVIDAEQHVQQAGVESSPADAPVVPISHGMWSGWRRYASIAATVVLVVGITLFLRLFDTPANEQQVTSIDFSSFAALDVNAVDLSDQVVDEVLTAATDYDVFEYYCDL